MTWRYRTVPAAVALGWLALLASAHLDGQDDTGRPGGAAGAAAAAVLLAGGLAAAAAHGMVEQQIPPASAGDVLARQNRALRRHHAAVGLSLAGAVWLLNLVESSAGLLVTSGALVTGFVLRSTARTRKAATTLARDADALLAAEARQGDDLTAAAERRRAREAVLISGRTGLDTGLAVGWWGITAVHRAQLARLAQHADGSEPLPPDLLDTIRWHRAAATGLLDAAA